MENQNWKQSKKLLKILSIRNIWSKCFILHYVFTPYLVNMYHNVFSMLTFPRCVKMLLYQVIGLCRKYRISGNIAVLENLAKFGGSRRNTNFLNNQNFHRRSYIHLNSLEYRTKNEHKWTLIVISSKAFMSKITCWMQAR